MDKVLSVEFVPVGSDDPTSRNYNLEKSPLCTALFYKAMMTPLSEVTRCYSGILRTAIQAVKGGADPKGIIRDAVKAKLVPTTAGSVIRD